MGKRKISNPDNQPSVLYIVFIVIFILSGLIVGIVGLYLEGWDLMKLLNHPISPLIVLLLLGIGISLLFYYLKKKINSLGGKY